MPKFGIGEYVLLLILFAFILLKCFNLTIFVGATVILVASYLIYEKKRLNYFKEQGIPGPEPTLIFGNTELFFQNEDMHCDMEWPEKYGPIFGIYAFGVFKRAIFVSDMDILRNVLIKDFNKFTDRMHSDDMPAFNNESRMLSKFLDMARGQRWKDRRRTVTPAFTTGKIKMMSTFVLRCMKIFGEILDEYAEECKPLDVKQVPYRVWEWHQDIDCQRDKSSTFRKYCIEMMELSFTQPMFLCQILFPQIYTFIENKLGRPLWFREGEQFFRNAIGAIIEQRKAGTTLAKELSYAAICKMPYIEATLSETLRLYPPAPRTFRVITEDAEYNGIKFRKGDSVVIPMWYFHHNENYFPDPYKFEPERFLPENRGSIDPMTYMPFGAGPRNCIGMRFAQMQIRMTMASLMHNYNFDPLPDTPAPCDLKFDGSNMFTLRIKGKPIELSITKRTK